MTFVPLALASTLLAFGPQVVHSFNSITFSAVQQCGNFSVKFAGGKLPASLPLVLTVVPFNLTPISIEIATSSWDNVTLTGAAITFLPFPADTQFVASLDDANGVGTGPVSDIIHVDSSSNTSCLDPAGLAVEERYRVATPLSQCQEFNVTFDPALVDSAPTVRAFVPKGPSLFLNQDVANSAPGRAPYGMAAVQGEQVVLTLSDDTGFRQATDLLVVQGNSSSPTGCLPSSTYSNHPAPSPSATGSTKAGLSRGGVIAIAVVCTASVGGIAVAMAFWFRRERRRIRQTARGDSERRGPDGFHMPDHQGKMPMFAPDAPNVTLGAAVLDTKPLPKTPSITSWPKSDDSVVLNLRNPPYTKATLDIGTPSPAPLSPAYRESLGSLTASPVRHPSIPIPMYTPKSSFSMSGIDVEAPRDLEPIAAASTTRAEQPQEPQAQPTTPRTPSLSSDDIENILDMATMYGAPTPGTMRSSIMQRESASVLPSWRVSQDGGGASPAPSHALRTPGTGSLRPSPTSTRTPGLLTPLSEHTNREPPQAQLPSSPVPSPMTPGFPRPSVDGGVSTRTSSVGYWEIMTPRS